MIRLTRVRTTAAIPAKYRGEKRIEQALKLLIPEGTEHSFEQTYWKNAKKQLKKEAHNKCAYCEASTAVVAHGDVEHFRPKSVYWWLAYCYDNYLYACQICNQVHKSDNFPVKDESYRTPSPVLISTATEMEKREFARLLTPDPLDIEAGQPWPLFEQTCTDEGGRLLNPYTEDPELHLKWEAKPTIKEVLVVARDEEKPYWQAAVDYYGLNREELKAERWKVYRVVALLCNAYLRPDLDAGLKEETKTLLQAMMANDAPFAAMCRFAVREVHGVGL